MDAMGGMQGAALRHLAGGGGADPDAPREQKIMEAFGWGFLSASSLVFGSLLGIYRLPSKVVRASMMAFGGGALIEALSIELFAHIIATAKGGHGGGEHGGGTDHALVFIALGSAVFGGLLFAGLDYVISGQGGFLRKASTLQSYAGRLRSALLRRLVARLKVVPMFEVLTTPQLEKLAKSMVKEKYSAGATIFRELSSDSSIFFLMSGQVELTVKTRYMHSIAPGTAAVADSPLAGAAPREDPGGGELQKPGAAEKGGGLEEEVVDCFRLGPNDIFGELALFTGETLQAQAVAAVASTVLRIPSTAIHHLLASNRRLQDFVAMTAIDRLRETEVFRYCTPSTVQRLVKFSQQAEFEAGDVLFYDVDSLCPIYFVVLGRVKVVRGKGPQVRDTDPQMGGGDGSGELDHHVVGANELLGTEHLVFGHAVPVTATAVERTTVLIVPRNDIDKLTERDERFRQALVASATGGARSGEDENALAVAVDLEPPEGAAGPAKFGCAALEELGWVRHATPPHARDHPKPAEPEADEGGGANDESDMAGLFAGPGGLLTAESDLPDLLEGAGDLATAEAVKGGMEHGSSHGLQTAIMIWIGILIDGVPESLVMGILANTATQAQLVAFVVGVFLANFPEAMSSASTMRLHGMRRRVILLMWGSITLLTGFGALLGAAIFPPGSTDDPVVQKVVGAIEGLCGGAMLCMIANTVLPEAFEQGGNVTGLSTLFGFLTAITVSVVLS